jgi:hypothetical protein
LFASISLPVGAALFLVVAGASGAAAATVIQPEAVSRVASFVTPRWAEPVLPDALQDPGSEKDDGAASPPVAAPPAPEVEGESTKGPSENAALERVTISGTIERVTGNTFILASGDERWRVQRDAKTTLDGEISEGAQAEVTGVQSGGATLHAEGIVVTSAADAKPETDDRAKPPKTPPGQSGANPSSPGGNGNGAESGAGDPPGLSKTPKPGGGGNGAPNSQAATARASAKQNGSGSGQGGEPPD